MIEWRKCKGGKIEIERRGKWKLNINGLNSKKRIEIGEDRKLKEGKKKKKKRNRRKDEDLDGGIIIRECRKKMMEYGVVKLDLKSKIMKDEWERWLRKEKINGKEKK